MMQSQSLRLPSIEELKALAYDRENQAKAMIVCWYIALGMMVLGYLIMAYLLFLDK
ncbi:MAG: hypothetical protein WBZ29_00705 [Methanocella sp.]